MKRIYWILPILIIGMLVCLSPKRDNDWDPDNPDKASVVGKVEGPDGAIKDAQISLLLNEEMYDSVFTDGEGFYEITEIDPGIYTIHCKAVHFNPVEVCAESLPAGTDTTLDIYMGSMYFGFDEEIEGTQEPFGFSVLSGNWAVIQDAGQPGEHSTPMVYNGKDTVDTDFTVAVFDYKAYDFTLNANLKVVDIAGSEWTAGIIFRYVDDRNFYFLGIAPNSIFLHKRFMNIDHPMDSSVVTISTETWYNLKVQACGTNISVFLDDDSVFSVDDNSISGDSVGLWVSNYQTNTTASVNFDDVTLCR